MATSCTHLPLKPAGGESPGIDSIHSPTIPQERLTSRPRFYRPVVWARSIGTFGPDQCAANQDTGVSVRRAIYRYPSDRPRVLRTPAGSKLRNKPGTLRRAKNIVSWPSQVVANAVASNGRRPRRGRTQEYAHKIPFI